MLLFILLVVFVALALGLAWFLIARDRGEKEPILALWLAGCFGLLAGVAAGLLEGWLVQSRDLLPGANPSAVLQAALIVGLIEELCKFVPLAMYLYRRHFFNEYTDGIIYFALAGLGFGLPENILYAIQFGAKSAVARVVLTPFFHSAIAAMVGFFLIRYKLSGRSRFAVVFALMGAVILHALYDFGLASGIAIFATLSLLITLGMTAALFILYARATELDQDHGKSVVGKNTFCRSCGKPNPEHLLYCTHCGKNA